MPRIPPGVVVGAKAVLRATAAAQPVRRIVVAADAPVSTTDPVRRAAAEQAVPVIVVGSSEELGRLVGLCRPVAAAAELVLGTKVPA
ncbi:MAG TPA: ribosomal L7Ae/L30e/S12e/Gadd45 family protein [Frankiaceae bacterium]|nr:ribosomal L7Ae/L30e/S12e/Gadd45 family protein [Frankiaceae bacterium]